MENDTVAVGLTAPQHAHLDGEKHDGVEHMEEVPTNERRNVTQVESTKINDAIAAGIADNVDDFMV